jgi:hypothetical protein
MSKAAREYHLIDLVGTSHGGFETLAGARPFARQEALPAWDIFHGNDRIEYHDPDDREGVREESTARPLDVSANQRAHAFRRKLARHECRPCLRVRALPRAHNAGPHSNRWTLAEATLFPLYALRSRSHL